MALLTVQQMSFNGLAPTYSSATATTGDTVAVGDRTFVHIKNGGGSSITATLTTPGTASGLAIADVAVTVPAGADRFIGPITPASLFADTSGLANITCSAVTSVTIAAVRV